MAHGGAVGEFRPRTDTQQWAAAATVGCAVLAIASRDATYLFPGAMCLALLLQTTQRIVVEGGVAQRFGLRPVELDLGTAYVEHAGSPWWRELFLCGPSLQLRDADGRRLYLESWLWDADTRDCVLEAAAADAAV
jgi:hypothetical protein